MALSLSSLLEDATRATTPTRVGLERSRGRFFFHMIGTALTSHPHIRGFGEPGACQTASGSVGFFILRANEAPPRLLSMKRHFGSTRHTEISWVQPPYRKKRAMPWGGAVSYLRHQHWIREHKRRDTWSQRPQNSVLFPHICKTTHLSNQWLALALRTASKAFPLI